MTSFFEAAIGAAVGTVAGAFMAFGFERRRRRIEQEDNIVVAGNQAMFSLMRAWGDLSHYRDVSVATAKKKGSEWYTLGPHGMVQSAEKPRLDALAQLFESDPGLLNRVAHAWSFYESITAIIQERAEIFVNQAQPLIERGVGWKSAADMETIKGACGPRIHGILYDYAEQITSGIDDCISGLYETGGELRNALKKLYPNRRFIAWERNLESIPIAFSVSPINNDN